MITPDNLRFYVEYTLRQLKGFVPKDSPVEFMVMFSKEDRITYTVPQKYDEKDELKTETEMQGYLYY